MFKIYELNKLEDNLKSYEMFLEMALGLKSPKLKNGFYRSFMFMAAIGEFCENWTPRHKVPKWAFEKVKFCILYSLVKIYERQIDENYKILAHVLIRFTFKSSNVQDLNEVIKIALKSKFKS